MTAPLIPRGATVICTVGESYFDFANPEASVIDPRDIAHALSMLCRFTGHTRQFYSVAQHCVLTSYLVPPEHAFAALMHDAHEAFVGDVSSPLKAMCPDYKAIEDRCEAAVAARFGLTTPWPDEIKHADLVMLATEKRDLMAAADHTWALLDGIEPSETAITYGWQPHAAEREWFIRFDRLCPAEFRKAA